MTSLTSTFVQIKWTIPGLDVDQINAEADRIRGSILKADGNESVSCELYPPKEHMVVVEVPAERAAAVVAELVREGFMD